MEIYILLGVLLSATVFGLGYAIVGTFRNSKHIEENHQWLDTMDRDVHQRIDELYKQLDTEMEGVYRRIDLDYETISGDMGDFISRKEIDSRLDRLEYRVKSSFSDDDIDKLGYDLYKLKEQVDEFIRTYQNQ
jgi:heme oxygenase